MVHFRMLGQDMISYLHPERSNLIKLYSDTSVKLDEHWYIRLSDYRCVVGRLANDDAMIAGYVFRRAVTLLCKAINTSDRAVDRKDSSKQLDFPSSQSGWYSTRGT